jgi:hypothetical protein
MKWYSHFTRNLKENNCAQCLKKSITYFTTKQIYISQLPFLASEALTWNSNNLMDAHAFKKRFKHSQNIYIQLWLYEPTYANVQYPNISQIIQKVVTFYLSELSVPPSFWVPLNMRMICITSDVEKNVSFKVTIKISWLLKAIAHAAFSVTSRRSDTCRSGSSV